MYYIPLHVHTDASLDGAGTVQSLVAQAKKLDMTHLAMTDHGTLGNAVAFWSACDEAGITPILGIEAYFGYRSKRYHITLLSLDEYGFNNLVYLDSEAHAHNYSAGYPLVTLDMLDKYKSGLFALTGCMSSALYDGEMADALGYVGDLTSVMSRTNVALEVQFIGTHNTWERPLSIAKKLDMDYVITNDTHYPCQHQFAAHQAICTARRGFTYDSQHLWLKSADEIYHEASKWVDMKTIVDGFNNTLALAGFIMPWSMKAPPSLPYIEKVDETLQVALKDALKVDILSKPDRNDRMKRLQYEYRILKDKGFLDYIYILWDIVSWAKAQGIHVGPARGSGGGSYVLYLLGITSLDPIHFGLLFERFLNPGRTDYPDVDVDFESDRRSEVMEYASRRWGTLPIATYSCYSHKSAIHDIARVLTIPKDLEESAADSDQESEAFIEFINDKPNALVTYQTMLGQIRHRGKHAAGVIIPNRPVPIERSGDELVVAWAEGMNTKDLSKVGIVKYDLLGLTALSQLKRMEELTGASFPVENYSDSAVYDLFCAGDVAGVFQWSGSDGIRELTMRVAPRNFYDLTTCNALYRPGALDAGTAELYPEFMRSPRKLHPRIDQHLEKTYGVLCYQEQVMAIVAEVMGGDLGQADVVRRLISKAAVGDPKWEKQIDELHSSYLEKGKENGFDEVLLAKLWNEIYTHSGYSYNLSHATAYTLISYRMAWYKVYHRAAFTVAVLQYDKANAQTYILDAIEHGMQVAMPNVNYSDQSYTLHDNTIYLPLNDIAFLGETAVQTILAEREKGGKFASYEDFSQRIPKRQCNNRAKIMLERIGAFKGLTGDPGRAIDKYETIPVGSIYDTQLEILGYVIPSRELFAKIQDISKKPVKRGYTRFAGFISKLTNKRSVHGEYTVFTLSPSGSFWMRDARPSLKVGVFVSGSKSKFGHSTDVKTYRLDSGE